MAAGAVRRKITFSTIVLKEAVVPALVLFLNGAAYSAIITFIIRYGKSVGIATPSLFFTVYSCILLVVRLTSGRIVDKKGPGYIIVPGGFFFCGCLLLLAGLKNQWMLYGAALLLGPGYSGCINRAAVLSSCQKTGIQESMQKTNRKAHGFRNPWAFLHAEEPGGRPFENFKKMC